MLRGVHGFRFENETRGKRKSKHHGINHIAVEACRQERYSKCIGVDFRRKGNVPCPYVSLAGGFFLHAASPC